MSIIYQNAATDVTTITAGGGLFLWSSSNTTSPTTVPLLMLQIAIQYQRTVTPYYPINTTTTKNGGALYRVVGVPRGVLTAQGILAKNMGDVSDFLEAMGKSCMGNASEHPTLTFKPFSGCEDSTDSGKTTWFQLTGVMLESVGVNLAGGETALAQMPLQFSFARMETL